MSETAVAFETIDQDAYGKGPEDAEERTIADQASWETFWEEHRMRKQSGFGAGDDEDAGPPEVDFDSAFVLFVYAGQKNTGGHAIEVTNITLRGDVYDVEAVEQEPGEGCITTQSLTYPYHLVQVERGADDGAEPDVVVDKTTVAYTC